MSAGEVTKGSDGHSPPLQIKGLRYYFLSLREVTNKERSLQQATGKRCRVELPRSRPGAMNEYIPT